MAQLTDAGFHRCRRLAESFPLPPRPTAAVLTQAVSRYLRYPVSLTCLATEHPEISGLVIPGEEDARVGYSRGAPWWRKVVVGHELGHLLMAGRSGGSLTTPSTGVVLHRIYMTATDPVEARAELTGSMIALRVDPPPTAFKDLRAAATRVTALLPLWNELTASMPCVSPWGDAVRESPSRHDAHRLWWQQLRVVTEIADARRRLAEERGARRRAARLISKLGLPAAEAAAAVDGVCLRMALAGWGRGSDTVPPPIPGQSAEDAARFLVTQQALLQRPRVQAAITRVVDTLCG